MTRNKKMTAEEFFNNQVSTDENNCFVDVYAYKYNRSDLIRFAEAYHKAMVKDIMDRVKAIRVVELTCDSNDFKHGNKK